MSAPSTLVIQHGDLPSMVLLLVQPDPSQVIAWHPKMSDEASPRRDACAESLAAARGVADFVSSETAMCDCQAWLSFNVQNGAERRAAITDADREGRLLLDAAIIARHFSCTRICSPWAVGPDHTQVSRALERAMLIAELCEIDAEDSGMTIDLPVIDRSDSELIELAVDLGAPWSGFWPCEHAGEMPCRACHACMRWIAAFEDVGVAWPFEPSVAAG